MKCLHVLLICSALIASALCTPRKYNATDGREYLIETEYKYNWFEAWHECAQRDSQLVIIDTAQKNAAIIELLKKVVGKSLNLWLGGNDDFSSSADYNRPFFWFATGKRFTFSYWSASNPNNYKSAEHCIHIWETKPLYQWNDIDCIKKMGFICEQNHFLENYNKQQNIECDAVKKFKNDISANFERMQMEQMSQLSNKLRNIEQFGKDWIREAQKLENITQGVVQKIIDNQLETANGLSDKIQKHMNDLNGQLERSVELINANFSETFNASLPIPFKNIVVIKQGG